MNENQKIKVLHIINSLEIGGLENGLINLINNSSADTFHHEICCVRTSGTAERRLSRPITIHDMNKRPGNDWHLIPRLTKLIKTVRPDIVHTRNWGTVDGIVAAKLAGGPAIIHGEHGWNMDDPYGRILRRRMIRRLLASAVNRFVAVSDDIKRWMIHSVGIKGPKIATIINGVDTTNFRPHNRKEIRQTMGLSDEDIAIGTVGRLDPIKDQKLLLNAFDKVETNDNRLRLLLIGDGPERNSLENMRRSLDCRDRVAFLGERNDVDNILPALDIFVLPSKNEGISNTILEAMACALPVVATSVGGNVELVTHGKTGLLFPSGDADALAAMLEFYATHPDERRMHGANGRLDAETKFSLTRMVHEYESLYNSLFKNSIRK